MKKLSREEYGIIDEALEDYIGMSNEVIADGEDDSGEIQEDVDLARSAQQWLSDYMKTSPSNIVRRLLQAAYCTDYDTYVEVMHEGVWDYYTREKFDKMQSDVTGWFCELDQASADRFMEYVLNKEG